MLNNINPRTYRLTTPVVYLAIMLAPWFILSELEAQEPNEISHGPMLGRPGSTSMGVWARTKKPGYFRVFYGTKKNTLDMKSKIIKTELIHDNTAWIELKNLTPDTQYFYAVGIDRPMENPERQGSFKTFAKAENYQNAFNPRGLFNFSFSATSCGKQHLTASQGNQPYATMLEKLSNKIQFAIQPGDWIYEEQRDLSINEWLDDMGGNDITVPGIIKGAPALPGVWRNYRLYFERDPNLAAWHRHIPSYFMFDDHEVLNDFHGAAVSGYVERSAVFRDIGLYAWRDYAGWSNPVDAKNNITLGKAHLQKGSDLLVDKSADFSALNVSELTTLHIHWGGPMAGYYHQYGDKKALNNALDKAGPQDPNAGVYDIIEVVDKNHLRISPAIKADTISSYSIGTQHYYKFTQGNAEFFVLDARSERHLSIVGKNGPRGHSILGKRQKQWLKQNMANSKADFLFVISAVSLTIPHTNSNMQGEIFSDDSWTGYLREREELIGFWNKLDQPVVILTGDMHNSYAIKVDDNIWEFLSGPSGSLNRAQSEKLQLPANGPYISVDREIDIRWSTHFRGDTPSQYRKTPVYTVFQINNVFNNPGEHGEDRWVSYEKPQLVVQFYHALNGDLLYAETLLAN